MIARTPALRAATLELRDRVATVARDELTAAAWSFKLLTRGGRAKQQALGPALAAGEARAQVVKALKQARAAWRELRGANRGEHQASRSNAQGNPKDCP